MNNSESSSPLRIGVLGLDTSHAETFAEEFTSIDDATVSAVWDGGAVQDETYLQEFCETYDARAYDDPSAMLGDLDAVTVLTVDWDTHRELAVPFLEAGVPTFVDKVVAGTVDDLAALDDAASEASLFGGSSIPFHPTLEACPRGTAGRTLYAASYNDPFYYGVHAVDSVRSIADAPWARVTPQPGPGIEVEVTFENNVRADIRFDGNTDQPAFGFLDVADRTRTARITVGDGYEAMREAFFEAFLSVVRGERDDTDRILDAATLQLAIHAAIEADESVTPGDEALRAYHADGAAYANAYATDRSAAVRGDW
ncbi:Gfo/Idh/MocA family protein [Saliphagus sp. LR7]|uniref:Gfo/Idh/MocA family protein n=1 Tax=Saliphagus sp. LR7 TaxID=2282654 RepID=UPI00130044AF|nr:Gfo/Idh/MocA family oxidoreductase [Saliphagus sp. LR7]